MSFTLREKALHSTSSATIRIKQGAFLPAIQKLTISVQTNQSKEGNYSASDFLVATKDNVKSSSKDVELKFKHKLTNIKLTITPGKDTDIDKMLEDDPQIIATGFCSQAEYDFLEDEFTPTGSV